MVSWIQRHAVSLYLIVVTTLTLVSLLLGWKVGL